MHGRPIRSTCTGVATSATTRAPATRRRACAPNPTQGQRHGVQRRQRVHADRHLPGRRLHRREPGDLHGASTSATTRARATRRRASARTRRKAERHGVQRRQRVHADATPARPAPAPARNPSTCTASRPVPRRGHLQPGDGRLLEPDRSRTARRATTATRARRPTPARPAPAPAANPVDVHRRPTSATTRARATRRRASARTRRKANGTACNDGNACTQTDTCQTGTCTGTTLDFTTDKLNCGVCGHSCLGGDCVGGVCQPYLIGQIPSMFDYARETTVTGGKVYVFTQVGQGSAQNVWQFDPNTTTANPPEVMTGGSVGCVMNGVVYWLGYTSPNYLLQSCTFSNCAATTQTLVNLGTNFSFPYPSCDPANNEIIWVVQDANGNYVIRRASATGNQPAHHHLVQFPERRNELEHRQQRGVPHAGQALLFQLQRQRRGAQVEALLHLDEHGERAGHLGGDVHRSALPGQLRGRPGQRIDSAEQRVPRP